MLWKHHHEVRATSYIQGSKTVLCICFEVNDIQSVVEYKVLSYRTDIEGDVGSNSYKYIFMAAQVTTIEVVEYTREYVKNGQIYLRVYVRCLKIYKNICNMALFLALAWGWSSTSLHSWSYLYW